MIVNKRRRRPTKTEQLQIQKDLQGCFEKNYSASFTSRKTGINIKTVCKYFKKWFDQLQNSEETSFYERVRVDRARMILSYDGILSQYYDILDEINDDVSELRSMRKPIPQFLFQKKLDVLKSISNLHEKKGAFLVQPPLDESLDKIIEEKMKKNDRHS